MQNTASHKKDWSPCLMRWLQIYLVNWMVCAMSATCRLKLSLRLFSKNWAKFNTCFDRLENINLLGTLRTRMLQTP